MRRLTREETESVNESASSTDLRFRQLESCQCHSHSCLPISSRSADAALFVGGNVTGAQRALTVARMKRLPRLSSAIRAFRAANLASAKLESLPSFG